MNFPTYQRQQTTPATPLMRFLTVGGATVEVHSYRFQTNYTSRGRPYASDRLREVDGFVWQCLGCGTHSRDSFLYDDGYLPNEHAEARDHANAHACECRAMPKPETAR